MDCSFNGEGNEWMDDEDTPTEPGDLFSEVISDEDNMPRSAPGRLHPRIDLTDQDIGEFDELLLPKPCEPAPIHAAGVFPFAIEEDQVLFDDSITGTKNSLIRTGDTVELGLHLMGTGAYRSGDFLRVRKIFTNILNSRVTLRGSLFKRTHKLHGMLPRKLNEVFLVLRQRISVGTEHTILTDHYVDVPLSDVIGKRQLILTNCAFPTYSFRPENGSNRLMRETIHNCEKLVCRWAFSGKISGHRETENSIRRLRKDEADSRCSKQEALLLFEWRQGYEQVGVNSDYPFVDVCCGAGGVSAGARDAGFTIQAALDHAQDCCNTFSLNHPLADVWVVDISHLNVETWERCWRCAVVHVSFPCQWCSVANAQSGTKHHLSVGGHNDEMNQAPIFAITQILRNTRARILTIEETPGLWRDERHQPVFYALINAIVSEGWSVKWRVLNFALYGLPQHRHRLIIIAACPGGVLPNWPIPYYGPGRFRCYRTIDDVISGISSACTHHDTDAVRRKPGAGNSPYSGRRMLEGCVMTKSNPKHPSGVRNFTLRELACLQGFSKDYQFCGSKTEIRKQIGNAVPPIVAEGIFKQVKRALQKQDQELVDVYAQEGM